MTYLCNVIKTFKELLKPTLSYTVSLRDLGCIQQSFSNKMQNQCLGKEQKEHQQSLETQDKYKLLLLIGRWGGKKRVRLRPVLLNTKQLQKYIITSMGCYHCEGHENCAQ